MSVQGSGGFDDFQKQHVANTLSVGASEPTGISLHQFDMDVLDGLSRGEVAELVALINNGSFIYGLTGSNTAFGVHADIELSTSPDPEAISENNTIPETGTEVLPDVSPVAASSGADATRYFRETISDEVLYHASPHNYGPTENSTDGVGLGGSMHMDHGHIDFREMFGGGPRFDQHSKLFEHWSIEKQNTDAGVAAYSNWTFVWDVQERR